MGKKSSSGVQGRSSYYGVYGTRGSRERSALEAETKCEIYVYNFQRFTVENFGFDEHRAELGQYFS